MIDEVFTGSERKPLPAVRSFIHDTHHKKLRGKIEGKNENEYKDDRIKGKGWRELVRRHK